MRERALVIELEKTFRGDYYYLLAIVSNKNFVRLEIGETDELSEESLQLISGELTRFYEEATNWTTTGATSSQR